MFLFNNPSNPTGMVYSKEEIIALADVLVKYPDTWVITDDIYNRMVFDGVGYHNFVHARPELRDRVIFIDSLSKTYGMPGWRVGFMAGPEVGRPGDRDDELQPHHQHARKWSAPPRSPRCAGRRTCRGQVRRVPGQARPGHGGDGFACPAWSARVRRARSTCSRTSASPSARPHGPSGTLIGNDVDFCNALLETKGVACVPGSAFGEPRALRISYTCPTPQLAPGLQRIQEFFAELS